MIKNNIEIQIAKKNNIHLFGYISTSLTIVYIRPVPGVPPYPLRFRCTTVPFPGALLWPGLHNTFYITNHLLFLLDLACLTIFIVWLQVTLVCYNGSLECTDYDLVKLVELHWIRFYFVYTRLCTQGYVHKVKAIPILHETLDAILMCTKWYTFYIIYIRITNNRAITVLTSVFVLCWLILWYLI